MRENLLIKSCKACCLLFALLLQACQHQPESVRVGISPWLGFEPVHIAKTLHLKQSDSYHLFELTTPSHVMHALRSDQVDVAFLSLSEAIKLISDQVEISVVAVVDQSAGGDALVAQSEFKDLTQLQGKRIGYESLTVASLLVDDWLEHTQHDAEDFILVEAKLDEQLDLFRRGEIDAVMTAGPLQQRLVDNLSANVIYDSSTNAGEYYRVIVVRNAALKSQKHHVSHLLSSFYAGSEWISEHQREAYKLIAKRNQLYSNEVQQAFDKIKILNKADNDALFTEGALLEHANHQAHRMHVLNLISNLPELEAYFSDQWLMELPGV